ncbi:glycosyltransferase-like protein LARGE [Clonorchis sinensis]|uniref:Glycosyltransferase-like protein LARGE n=1 Tax=Clonorchis sinensis TaxID=79923 RepID=G7YPX8_CLOSI|nr:glycosyltransferase-like protein LARGE [Clonorchis sinensis]
MTAASQEDDFQTGVLEVLTSGPIDRHNQDMLLGRRSRHWASRSHHSMMNMFTRSDVKIFLPMEKRGINTGVLLIHLQKLRKVSWHRMWMDTIQDLLKRTKNLKAADQVSAVRIYIHIQDIYNAIFGIHPELLYQLPCTWNVQVIRNANINHCPVSWPVRYFDEHRCGDANQSSLQDQAPSQQTVNIVHFCGDGKPVPNAPYSPENFTFIPTLRTYNSELKTLSGKTTILI